MSYRSLCQPGFPLRLEQFEKLFAEVAAVTTLSLLLFAILGALYSNRASAEVVDSHSAAVSSDPLDEDSSSVSTSAIHLDESLSI
ncbi:MAG: hypothetical protein Kow00121_36470 [Elainellaceae cyanobacterium]